MVLKHNNQLPNQHFRKGLANPCQDLFDQAGRKSRRRANRVTKALRIAPRPIDGLICPAVRCPTIKYNTKLRAGRGFTLEELKAAGVRRKEAISIGVSVNFRRCNRSEESLQLNVNRLKAYKAKLIVFPRKAGKVKKGDSEISSANFAKKAQIKVANVFPVEQRRRKEAARAITEEEKNTSAYAVLYKARSDARLAGGREKRAKAKTEEESSKVGKK